LLFVVLTSSEKAPLGLMGDEEEKIYFQRTKNVMAFNYKEKSLYSNSVDNNLISERLHRRFGEKYLTFPFLTIKCFKALYQRCSNESLHPIKMTFYVTHRAIPILFFLMHLNYFLYLFSNLVWICRT
jgi:hypothetical protein